jgi:hypothetical protein
MLVLIFLLGNFATDLKGFSTALQLIWLRKAGGRASEVCLPYPYGGCVAARIERKSHLHGSCPLHLVFRLGKESSFALPSAHLASLGIPGLPRVITDAPNGRMRTPHVRWGIQEGWRQPTYMSIPFNH